MTPTDDSSDAPDRGADGESDALAAPGESEAGTRPAGPAAGAAEAEADTGTGTDAGVEDDDGNDEDDAQTAGRRRLRSGIEWAAVLGGAVVVALIVRTFLFTTFWIPSASMEPTLIGEGRHDRVIVNRLSYKLHDVNRGDIIVFEVPPGEPTMTVDGKEVRDLIKRVVGLGGETVELRDGKVYIDGKRLAEPYLPEGTPTEPCPPGGGETTFEIPEGAVFVMGDNRTASLDARCWQVHYLKESAIVGRAFVRIWPLGEFGGI